MMLESAEKKENNSRRHENIVKSKILAFSLTSPIDTVRQNIIVAKRITSKKLTTSIIGSALSCFMIASPCHLTMNAIESRFRTENLWSESIPLIAGVIIGNAFKLPVMYYYKRFQTGVKLSNGIPKGTFTKLLKVSLAEDVIEESAKMFTSKRAMLRKENRNRTYNSDLLHTFIDMTLLFAIAYPFDVLKNKNFHNMTSLVITTDDFLLKAAHKNLQNVAFLSFISIM